MLMVPPVLMVVMVPLVLMVLREYLVSVFRDLQETTDFLD